MPKRGASRSDAVYVDLEIASEAVRRVGLAIGEHIITLRSLKSLADPDDLAAQHILTAAYLNLPENPRMARAAAAAGFTALGPRGVDDRRPLLDLAYRVRRGELVTPASFKAAKLAADYTERRANSIATRLRRKYRKDGDVFDGLIKDALSRDASLDDIAAELFASPQRAGTWRNHTVRRRPKRRGNPRRPARTTKPTN